MAKSIFEPELSHLSTLATDITAAVEAYGSAQTPHDRGRALQSIAQNSGRLSNAATSPADAFSDFTFRPLANTCIRIAISIGLFEHLPLHGNHKIEDIARLTRAEFGLVERVVRTLVAFDILGIDAEGRCSHTPLSLTYTDTSSRAWATWMHDVMINASGDIGSYFESHAMNSPTDAKDSPITWARRQTGADIFEIVKNSGKLQLFVDAMSGSSVICAKEAVATYDFGRLSAGEDGVVLVDVGGNKGQTLKEIKDAYPALEGRLIVQDLKMVVDSGLIPGLEEAEFHAYDFFKDIEPVKGMSNAYGQACLFVPTSDDSDGFMILNV